AAGEGYSTATDLADWLVRKLDMPFREAHHVTGRIVAQADAQKVPLQQLSLAAMQAIEPRITRDVFRVLSVENSVKSRLSRGKTRPGRGGDGAADGAGGGKTMAQSSGEEPSLKYGLAVAASLRFGCPHCFAGRHDLRQNPAIWPARGAVLACVVVALGLGLGG